MKNGLRIVKITHGGTKRKESNENNAETIDILRQPIEEDCLIYDSTYNDIRIHMENKTIACTARYSVNVSMITTCTGSPARSII